MNYPVSIEIAHACAGESLSHEPAMSLRALPVSQDAASFAVLLDDTGEAVEGVEDFLYRLGRLDLPGLMVVRESRLAPVALQLLESLPKGCLFRQGFRREGKVVTFFQPAGRKPVAVQSEQASVRRPLCPLLSAAWTACRLGLWPWPPGCLAMGEYHRGKRAVNILPQSMQAIEGVAVELLRSTGRLKAGQVATAFY